MQAASMPDQALTRRDEAARHLDSDADVLGSVNDLRDITTVHLMIRMDEASRKSFLAWRCSYDDTCDTTLEEVEAPASFLAINRAGMNLPYGGGKAAMQVDPGSLSKAELERLSCACVQALARFEGPIEAPGTQQFFTN